MSDALPPSANLKKYVYSIYAAQTASVPVLELRRSTSQYLVIAPQ